MIELAREPGSYRWYYVDVSAGEWSAVAIFMMGSLFSPRYVGRRQASPLAHAAVNFALYRHGVRRAWVLTEYDGARLEASEHQASLCIGASRFTRRHDGAISIELVDRTTWSRSPLEARVELVPEVESAGPVVLVPGLSHQWHPYAIRARAQLEVRSFGVAVDGRGYHDGNFGQVALGTDLTSWTWLRTHEPTRTRVSYWPCVGDGVDVVTEGTKTIVRPASSRPGLHKRTGWGLAVPAHLDGAGLRLLESSPFYARFEARDAEREVMGEAADFARFRSPFVRWMADVRTRVVRQPAREAR